jgi:hypothetical protein
LVSIISHTTRQLERKEITKMEETKRVTIFLLGHEEKTFRFSVDDNVKTFYEIIVEYSRLANVKMFHIDDTIKHFNVYINGEKVKFPNDLNRLPKKKDEIQLEWKE